MLSKADSLVLILYPLESFYSILMLNVYFLLRLEFSSFERTEINERKIKVEEILINSQWLITILLFVVSSN